MKPKIQENNSSIDSYFSAFLGLSNSIAIHLDSDFKVVNLNSAAKKYYRIRKINVLGKDFSFLEKNNKMLQLLAKVKQQSNYIGRLISQTSENKKDNLPVTWLFLNLEHLYNVSGYLVMGNILLPKQYAKIQNEKIEGYLKEITDCMPGNFYWKDKDGRYLGCSQDTLMIPGYKSEQELIGKTDYDIWPEQAEELRKNDAAVMASGKPTYFEETVQLKGQKPKFYAVVKIPLKDANGNIIGIIGNSLDITYRKEAEHLKLENELQKTKLQEQEMLKTIVSQVAHDIRSPLASLSMIVKSCKSIPETERIALRDVALSIGDIANNLLSKYKCNGNEIHTKTKTLEYILVSLSLSEVLSEKKYQYKHLPVKFNYSFDSNSSFVSIQAEASDFNRMLSNLLNNAVEALEGKAGKIDLKLNLLGEHIRITIKDNGKGMSQKIIDKIMSGTAVTSGKKDGNGIGLTQVQDTLRRNHGKIVIDSKIGRGTKITLTFPRRDSVDWVVKQIELNKDDTVIILDDDNSIHNAWEIRFKDYADNIHLKHFKVGEKVIDFINAAAEKNKMFLLVDFELINQELNGLQIIEQTSMQQRSILVTSHYGNQNVRDLATKAGVKILPKQLASDIPIKIEKERKGTAENFKKVDLVIIDDDQLFADSLANFFKDKFAGVEAYYDPNRFLKNLSQYAKDTKICMDNHFQNHISGIELAKQLNEAGYTKLYLLSGKTFEKREIPNYLTVLLKGDVECLDKLV